MMLTLLRITPKHTEAWRALVVQALATCPQTFSTTPQEWAQKTTEELHTTLRQDYVLGAWHATDGLIGIAACGHAPREKLRHKAHIYEMYVVPTHRRHGVMQQLLAELEHALGDSFQLLRALVAAHNEIAQACLQGAGYAPLFTDPKMMWETDRWLAGVTMQKELRTR